MSSKVTEAAGVQKIDPEAYVSVELSTSSSTVQVKRKKLELLIDSKLNRMEETKS